MEAPDLEETLLLLPSDAKLLAVSELAPRLRETLNFMDGDGVVITRPGFRMTARQVPVPLASLLLEFRTASRLTDAVQRFSASHGQDPQEILELSFDALFTCVIEGILVDASSPEATAPEPRLASGQAFAGMEVLELVRALNDSEIYRVIWIDGRVAALKLARHELVAAALEHESRFLKELDGQDAPLLYGHGTEDDCAWIAIEWLDGVAVSVAAQQARSMGDRASLASIISRVLAAYARLHARGIIHGDIHTGNILVEDDGGIALIDFGRASRIGNGQIDLNRVGVPQFYDPEMAASVLKGDLPPAATVLSEQYALAILSYLLLTGLHPINPSANQQELLTKILTRPPLPFVARGVDPWLKVENVLSRALAKEPTNRFSSTASFADAFDRASRIEPDSYIPTVSIAETLETLRNGVALPRLNFTAQAWLAFRAALVRSDEELLAAADIAISQADSSFESLFISTLISRARGERSDEQSAINTFVESGRRLHHEVDRLHALLLAAQLLQGAEARGLDIMQLRHWAAISLEELWASNHPDILYASLALEHAGAVRMPADARIRLDSLSPSLGSAWLWSLAYELFANPNYADYALNAKLPSSPLLCALHHVRLYQLSGKGCWLDSARRIATILAEQPSSFAYVLVAIELEAPARSMLPPWRLLRRNNGKHS